MSSVDRFLPEIRPYAPGVPDATAYKNIRLAAIEFCERTRLWRFEDEYTVTASDCEQVLTPAGSALHDIEVIMFDGRELRPVGTRDLDRLSQGWRTDEQTSAMPEYVTQINSNTIRIVPAAEGSLYLCLRLKPSQDTMDLPDFLATEYREVIGWGALGRLLMIPGQSYTNPDLAAFYMGRFTSKLDSLVTKGTKGQQNAPKRTRARFF
jgi:hypothetical protein